MAGDVSGPLTLAEALRGFREQRQLSGRAVSKLAGLSDSYMGKLETGHIDPLSLSVQTFIAITLALGLTSQEILFCVRCAVAEHRFTGVEEGDFPGP